MGSGKRAIMKKSEMLSKLLTFYLDNRITIHLSRIGDSDKRLPWPCDQPIEIL